MHRMRQLEILITLGLICPCTSAGAQSDQFLPEVNFYSKLHDRVRLGVQTRQTREAGDPVQAEFGPSVEFYLPPLVRLANVTAFDLDDAKSRPLVFSVGYRYLPQTNDNPGPTEWRQLQRLAFR